MRKIAGSSFVLIAVFGFIFAGSLQMVKGEEQNGRLLSAQLVYQGAFALPEGDEWTYSGKAIAHYPLGNEAGPDDGYSGSLYVTGHIAEQLVGEITIPAPIISDNFADLPRATVLLSQADITGGWINNCMFDADCIYREVAGLAYLPENGKIAWNLRCLLYTSDAADE